MEAAEQPQPLLLLQINHKDTVLASTDASTTFTMQQRSISIPLLLTLLLSLPIPCLAFWGSDGDDSPSLNLKSGYDINTVTTETGRIISIQTGDERPNVQLEVESSAGRIVICIGPQRYWAEKNMSFQIGDEISVRGSKAQGSEGVIYIMAQKIIDKTQNVSVILRDESGRPAWAGNGMRRNQGMKDTPTTSMRQQSPGGKGGRDEK